MSSDDKYLWQIGSPPPILDRHSQTKHNIVEDYVRRYVLKLMVQANIAVVALVVLFFIEAAVRQIQYKYIQKSIEVESSLKSILEGGGFELPDNGITTNIETPTVAGLLDLFQLRRWIFWFPYLLLLISSLWAIKILGNS